MDVQMLVPEISSSADVVPWKQRKRFYIRANTDSSSHRPQSHLDVLFCTLAVVVHMNNPHRVKVIFCQSACLPEYIVDIHCAATLLGA